MPNFVKILTLIFLLIIPALVFVFLKSFGTNKFDLDIYFENGVESNLWNCNFVQGEQHYVPSFSLISQDGTTVDDNLMLEGLTVVDFFFTTCPSICPIMTGQLHRVQEVFQDNPKVNLLSFTVDPENDDVETLASYAQHKGADINKWKFLTGEKEDIYRLARCGFVLPVEDGDGGPEDFIHSEKFILVDSQKRIRGFYDGTDREDVDRLITEIGILLTNM